MIYTQSSTEQTSSYTWGRTGFLPLHGAEPQARSGHLSEGLLSCQARVTEPSRPGGRTSEFALVSIFRRRSPSPRQHGIQPPMGPRRCDQAPPRHPQRSDTRQRVRELAPYDSRVCLVKLTLRGTGRPSKRAGPIQAAALIAFNRHRHQRDTTAAPLSCAAPLLTQVLQRFSSAPRVLPRV